MSHKKHKKMKRGPVHFERTPERVAIVNHCTSYHSHLKEWFESQPACVLVNWCHPKERESYAASFGLCVRAAKGWNSNERV